MDIFKAKKKKKNRNTTILRIESQLSDSSSLYMMLYYFVQFVLPICLFADLTLYFLLKKSTNKTQQSHVASSIFFNNKLKRMAT